MRSISADSIFSTNASKLKSFVLGRLRYQGGLFRRWRCVRSWVLPCAEVLGLVSLLAGFNLFDGYRGVSNATPPLHVSRLIVVFPDTWQIDRTIWNENTQQWFVFSPPTLAM